MTQPEPGGAAGLAVAPDADVADLIGYGRLTWDQLLMSRRHADRVG